jgi:hypothetical protein
VCAFSATMLTRSLFYSRDMTGLAGDDGSAGASRSGIAG